MHAFTSHVFTRTLCICNVTSYTLVRVLFPGHIVRNQMKGEGLEVIAIQINKTRGETEERLERYDMGEEYLIHM